MASTATAKAPKQKSGSKNAGKGKAAPLSAPAPAADKTEAPAPAEGEEHHGVALLAGGRPDQAAYNAEQEKYKADIAAAQEKLNAVRQKLAGGGKDGPQAERRQALRKEQDGLREQQAKIKDSRGKILAQIKASGENITKKIEGLKASKSKTQFKTTAEIDNRISQLEKQVDSASMKVVDEKRALAEISGLRRTRKNFEGFQGEEDSIAAERAKIDELKKQLDDPVSRSISERYDAIRNELQEIQKEGDELYASRTKLIEERNALQDKVNALWTKRKESMGAYQEARTKFIAKQQEERQRREERYRQQRAAEEADRIKEVTERLREEAQMPAYQAQIEDCQTLIDYFNIRLSGGTAPAPTTNAGAAHADIVGVKSLEIRQVEAAPSDGMIVRKKKGEDDDSYFVGGKGKGKKAPKAANGHANGGAVHEPKATEKLNLPFGTLTALLELSIPPPASNEDIPQTVENLQKKKAYFVAIQPKATQDQIAKAEAEIKKMQKKLESMTVNGDAKDDATADAPEALPPNGTGEKPAEPAATPAVADTLSVGVSSEAVDKELEAVKEDAEAEEAQ